MSKRPQREPRRRADAAGPPGRVRIIGGRWRGRRLLVRSGSGLRPSPDRVRETLFNWLEPYLPRARCLDLFAGTGVLGFEAISRGAKSVTLVESDPDLAQQLRLTRAALEAPDIDIVRADAIEWLQGVPLAFDIVFVDPPFDRGYVPRAASLLDRGWVARGGLVYVENERGLERDGMPADWRVIREGTTRHVSYALYRRGLG